MPPSYDSAQVAGDYLTIGAGPNAWLWPLPDRDIVTIGRDPASDLCLSTDDKVSRRHAELRRSDGRWWISDRSTNGSYVNGQRIGQQALNDGDQIRVGASEFAFHAAHSPTGGQTTIERPPQPQRGRADRGLAGKMLIAGVLQVLSLSLNALLTFVTDVAPGPVRWIVSQTAVVVIAMVMTGAGAITERQSAPSGAGGTPLQTGQRTRPRTGRPSLAAFVVVLLVLGVGGFAATAGVRYVVDYATGKETGVDRLVRPVTKNAAGLTLTVAKVDHTRHFTRVDLTVRNNSGSTSVTLPLFQNSVLSAADGTTLQADAFRSQWTETVPPGAFQRGTITFPGHLPDAATRASLSFSHVFGPLRANAISVGGLQLKAVGGS